MNSRWLAILVAVLALSLLGEFALGGAGGHGEFWWSDIRGFFALFGFASALLLILIPRLVGRYWLQKRDDYYDRDGGDD